MSTSATDTEIQARQSPMRRLLGVKVLNTGAFVPDNIVRNEDLASLGYDADWIVQRTGIQQRRHAPADMATSDMAIAAARQCIERAEVSAADIDLLILGTFTPDMPVPATACLVQDALGICCPAFDLQAACAGFVYAMVTGMQFVANGGSNLALVIGADTNSRIANPGDRKTYPLFGDGAGAVLIARGTPQQGLVSYTLGADGSGHDLLCRRMGGSRIPSTLDGVNENLQYLEMDGRPIFKWAIRLIEATVRDVLDESGVNVDRFGNTSAASIPLALDEAYQNGRIHDGSRVVICGFGAGLAWGTALLQC